ncbi:MAG TPA: phytanoyl-CoA dioxygenase family protein [Solirubrobacterales bacterium]|nr:phytanoyl-CoA dioxygenase family protein [Solirubrobacterales bacterium]
MVTRLANVVSRLRGADNTLREEIDELMRGNRERRDPEVERRLVHLRNAAFAKQRHRRPRSSPSTATEVGEEAARWKIVDGIPEIGAEQLDARVIRSAFLQAGCLLVRGLMQPAAAAELREGIDTALEHRDAFTEGRPAEETTPWFEPLEPVPPYSTEGADWNRIKARSGAVWACDSPRMMFELLDTFERAGFLGAATEYLGERPSFSMNKAVLRRTPPDTLGAWHQDGAFLGKGIRTLNIWLALSACGEDAPSLDMVPRRFESVLETGTRGAAFPWSVSGEIAEELLGGEDPARPVFGPGDAILFDHLCLHKTGSGPGMTETRYATETWCFASSDFPSELVPLLI